MDDPARLARSTVLVVDDEEGVRESVRAVLEDSCEVLLAPTGQDALDLLRGNEVDLVMLDQRMPGESGIERVIVSTDDELGKSIFPDIVVHRRAVPENLLAVEVRKATNHQPIEHDHHKLRGLTDPHLWFAYRIGVMLVLGKGKVKSSDVYLGGIIDRELSDWFAGRLREIGLA